jgi:hypothetical protein
MRAFRILKNMEVNLTPGEEAQIGTNAALTPNEL